MHPWKIIAIGFALVLLGFLTPLLIVIRIIEPSFALGFLSYGASLTGLILGLVGSALYSRSGKG